MLITNKTGIGQGSELFLSITSPVAKMYYYYIYEVGHYYLSRSYHFTSINNENKIFCMLLIKGELKLFSDNSCAVMVAGDFLLTVMSSEIERRTILHQITSDVEVYWFFAGGVNIYDYTNYLLNSYKNFGNALVFHPDSSSISFSFREIFRLLKENDYNVEQRISKQLYSLIVDTGASISVKTKDALPLLDKAMHFIENNYNSHIQLDDISNYVNLDKYYFSKLFKKRFGISPYQYLIKKRIQYAKYMLCTTDFSINYISEQIGYTDSTLFIRAFKNNTGFTPTAYRKQQENKQLILKS